MDLVYRLSQWGVLSDLHCSFLCESNGFATISITFLRSPLLSPYIREATHAPSPQECAVMWVAVSHHSPHKIGRDGCRGSDVRACNVVWLNVPAISAFEWHPVSIAAVLPGEDGLMSTAIFHMKTYGTWTQVCSLY